MQKDKQVAQKLIHICISMKINEKQKILKKYLRGLITVLNYLVKSYLLDYGKKKKKMYFQRTPA